MDLDTDVERLVLQEMASYFPDGRVTKFSEVEMQRIGQLLSHPTSRWRSSWSSAPRLYSVLRLINLESAMDEMVKDGITTDFWFPFNPRSLSGVLGPKNQERFINVQHMIETEGLFLEKDSKTGRKGEHQGFANDNLVPLIVRKFLGKGGFGEVHEVQSRTSLRIYARKQTLKSRGFIQTKEALAVFMRERDLLSKINHHHCIEFIGSYSTPKYLGLLVHPVAEINLEGFLVQAHASYPIEKPLLRTFFGCLSRGFQYLHYAMKIRHRDIKPANILIHDSRVKISDFGLSVGWADGRTTTTWSTCPGFSRRYCAPEVANAQARNSSSDIWSLGCIFLEIATVLKGIAVEDLLRFIVDYNDPGVEDTNHRDAFYWVKPKAIKAWTEKLGAMSNQDNEPLEWVNSMLDPASHDRPHASRLVRYTAYAGKSTDWPFCGLCCADDSDDEEGDEELNRRSKETGEQGLGVKPERPNASPLLKPPLQNAARDGDDKLVRLLLQNGAEIEARDENGWSALGAASYHGHLLVMNILLEKGANIHAKDESGRTALYRAATNGQVDAVALLLKNGADPEAKTTDGWTALYGAAFNGNDAVVELLLGNSADIEATTNGGRTALHAAALSGSPATVRLLLSRGANADARDDRGMTAVHCAALHGFELVQLLVQGS